LPTRTRRSGPSWRGGGNLSACKERVNSLYRRATFDRRFADAERIKFGSN
jgi:hypothetical protein